MMMIKNDDKSGNTSETSAFLVKDPSDEGLNEWVRGNLDVTPDLTMLDSPRTVEKDEGK